MAPSVRERFMMFTRDRERKNRAQGDSAGEGAMDLVSYVEFQNNFTSLLKIHRGALRANRRFWRLLIHHAISFRELSIAFESMDKTEAKADRTYRSVLERYPKSVKLLRAYAGFLEEARKADLKQPLSRNPLEPPPAPAHNATNPAAAGCCAPRRSGRSGWIPGDPDEGVGAIRMDLRRSG